MDDEPICEEELDVEEVMGRTIGGDWLELVELDVEVTG